MDTLLTKYFHWKIHYNLYFFVEKKQWVGNEVQKEAASLLGGRLYV